MKENEIIKDRYQLLRPLGAGGFGEVWLAKDQMTGTHCAIKFYVRLDDAGRSEFRGEYSRMLGIHHPNLLTAKYYDEWQGRPFLVMDYCGGGAASGKVGHLSETELWRLIRDVASGLACLHSQCVIHQDIKLANFLQKEDGTWLISDFGISSRMRSSMSSQSGREVSSAGNLPYLGPERFGQDRILVKASDIWALGTTVYEMATRDLPFGEYGGILQKKGEEIPHLPGERWSSDLDRLVSSCLQKETWDRPSAALVAEYANCKLKGMPLPRLPKETPPPPKPNPNPKPKLWKWMAAAGAVVAVVLAIVLRTKSDPDQRVPKSSTVKTVERTEKPEEVVHVPSKADVSYFVKGDFMDDKLYAKVDGVEYFIEVPDSYDSADPDHIYTKCYLVAEEDDFDGNGVTDALIEETLGCGNIGLMAYFIVSYSGDGYFSISNSLTGNAYFVENWKGKKSVVIINSNVGFDSDKLYGNKERYVLKDGKLELVETLKKQSVMAIKELKSSDFGRESEKPIRLEYDLDENGITDYFECCYWSRWGSMMVDYFVLNGKETDEPIGSAFRIGVLSSKTRGYHDLVIDEDEIYKWNGHEYVSTK